MDDKSDTGHDPYAPSYGPRVEVEALYLVQPSAGSKRLQATFLRLDDGREWILAYRPVEDGLKFFGKRVAVKGRTYTPSPMVQHVMATHFEIDSIELAPGEVAHDPVPTQLPAPPLARSLEDMGSRMWRWVHVQGKLVEWVEQEPGSKWVDGFVEIKEGERVRLEGLRVSDKLRALVGKDVTAMGRVTKKASLTGRVSVCEGHVERCGLTSSSPKREKMRPIKIVPDKR